MKTKVRVVEQLYKDAGIYVKKISQKGKEIKNSRGINTWNKNPNNRRYRDKTEKQKEVKNNTGKFLTYESMHFQSDKA